MTEGGRSPDRCPIEAKLALQFEDDASPRNRPVEVHHPEMDPTSPASEVKEGVEVGGEEWGARPEEKTVPTSSDTNGRMVYRSPTRRTTGTPSFAGQEEKGNPPPPESKGDDDDHYHDHLYSRTAGEGGRGEWRSIHDSRAPGVGVEQGWSGDEE
ncbi:unnamed protein product, partial [Discosporangium mesarthrocarpum]